MAKMITNVELAEILTKLLTGDEIDDSDQFSSLMTSAAKLVADHCGGEVVRDATFTSQFFLLGENKWMIGIDANDSLPEDGGIWKNYDTDVSFVSGIEVYSGGR